MPYNYGDAPFTNPTDTVRFLLHDTASPWQLSDGEITGLLANNAADPYQAAIEGCTFLIARYARAGASKSIGDASISFAERVKNLRYLQGSLAKQSLRHGGAPVPYAGGISKSDMEIDNENDDRVPMDFSIGMTDNPEGAPDFTSGGGFTQVVPE